MTNHLSKLCNYIFSIVQIIYSLKNFKNLTWRIISAFSWKNFLRHICLSFYVFLSTRTITYRIIIAFRFYCTISIDYLCRCVVKYDYGEDKVIARYFSRKRKEREKKKKEKRLKNKKAKRLSDAYRRLAPRQLPGIFLLSYWCQILSEMQIAKCFARFYWREWGATSTRCIFLLVAFAS